MIRRDVWDDFLNLPADAQQQVADLIADLRQKSSCSNGSGSGVSRDDDADMQSWRDDADYFESMRLSLCKDEAYRGKYIALRQQDIIDSDDDKFALVQRVRQQLPDDVVFVAKVQMETAVVEVPSPEIGP